MTLKLFLIPLCLAFGLSPALAQSPYDNAVLADRPVLYLKMDQKSFEPDLSGRGFNGTYFLQGKPLHQVRLPNHEIAADFDGINQYLEVRSSASLSIPASGVLTVEAWIRPSVLQFQKQEGSGYVYWLGKGTPNAYEYAGRMYSKNNSESRPNRISGYAWNLSGGLGSGSYFQDPIQKGEWVHIVLVYNTRAKSQAFPTGYVKIYKNSILRDTTSLSQFNVIPQSGTAPLRVGTRDFKSFFKGAVAKIAMYDYELSPSRIGAHGNAMKR